jgi:outer membrane protein TolC
MGAIPDLDLGVSKHRIVGTGSFWNLTLSVPIPLFWGRFRAGIAEARANASALQADLEQAERTIRQEVAEARRNADSACEQTELYRKGILDRAEEVYDMLAFSYRLGEIGGAELIQARRSLLEARSAFADAEHAYAVALAALQRSLGAPLEGAVQ